MLINLSLALANAAKRGGEVSTLLAMVPLEVTEPSGGPVNNRVFFFQQGSSRKACSSNTKRYMRRVDC